MKYAVVYISKTGNTAKVARAIREALPEGSCVAYGAPGEAAARADLIFAGSWTDKGACSGEMAAFLAGLSGKKVALFGTAGFGGSQEYFDTVLARMAKALPADCSMAGGFLCQGRMPQAVKTRYEAMVKAQPMDAQARAMLDNWALAYPHPDEADLEAARAFARRVVRENGGEK
ncbi:flavodoxin family protein [Anaerofilum sp. BX8]|uniref:Flavodoxin family protein n=1 Tax=Anaerofilum hominis TaxID=2763016 RepID=A0A923L0I5_9FIRM|nr:flavodoxin family protein BilS [Anaerofilum hominis]MBC5580402.1 flavodoxin family protein [Anaerofilum hominis]